MKGRLISALEESGACLEAIEKIEEAKTLEEAFESLSQDEIQWGIRKVYSEEEILKRVSAEGVLLRDVGNCFKRHLRDGDAYQALDHVRKEELKRLFPLAQLARRLREQVK